MTANLNLTLENSRKVYFENKLNQLKTIIDSCEDEPDYTITCCYELYKRLIENDQYEDLEVTEPIIVNKLIRCYRYIPNGFLDYVEADRVVMGGLFLTTKICIMPTSMILKCMRSNRLGAIINPENFGLPKGSEVDYGTTRLVNNRISTAIARGSWVNDWINHYYQYEYVTLSMEN